MRGWTPDRIASAAGARLLAARSAVGGPGRAIGATERVTAGPERAVIDSRDVGPGALFVGLRGRHADGGQFWAQALAAGAWGVLARPQHAEAALRAADGARAAGGAPGGARAAGGAAILAADDPLKALHRLANA